MFMATFTAVKRKIQRHLRFSHPRALKEIEAKVCKNCVGKRYKNCTVKENFSVTVLTFGFKVKVFEKLRLCMEQFWRKLRTRATFDRCVTILPRL